MPDSHLSGSAIVQLYVCSKTTPSFSHSISESYLKWASRQAQRMKMCPFETHRDRLILFVNCLPGSQGCRVSGWRWGGKGPALSYPGEVVVLSLGHTVSAILILSGHVSGLKDAHKIDKNSFRCDCEGAPERLASVSAASEQKAKNRER